MSSTSRLLRQSWLLPVAAMLIIGGVGIWRPGLWADELATWGAVTLPWPRLWRLLSNTDAVNGGYYVVVKLWTTVWGTGELALRSPSLVAMAVAAGLTAAIGARLWTPRWGLLAGLLFAVLPTASRYAAEARGYAFAVAFAAAATWLLVRLCQGGGRREWVFYAAAVVAAGVFHLMAVLVLCGHLVLLVLSRPAAWRAWLAATSVALAALAPLGIAGTSQIGQTAWIEPLSLSGLAAAPQDIFESRWTALLIAVLIVVAVWRGRDRVTLAVAGWALAPVVGLLALSLVAEVWVPRYLLFLLPAWALLAVRALAGVRWRIAASAALALVALSGLGAQYDIRRLSGHTHDTRGAAAVIEAGHRPGDGFAVALDERVVPWEARDLVARYVPRESRPDDTFATAPQRTDGRLLATECAEPRHCLGDTPRLWIVRFENPADPLRGIGEDKERLLRREFTVSRVWPLRGLTVALLSRR